LKDKKVAYFGPYDKSAVDKIFPNYNEENNEEVKNNDGLDLEKPV